MPEPPSSLLSLISAEDGGVGSGVALRLLGLRVDPRVGALAMGGLDGDALGADEGAVLEMCGFRTSPHLNLLL